MSVATTEGTGYAKRKERTRNAIIEAARHVLQEQGFADTTIELIIARAGVSRASYYAHFQDKADVARAIIESMWKRSEEMYLQFAAMDGADVPRVRRWLQHVMAQWSQNYREVLALARDLPTELATNASRHMDRHIEHLVGNDRLWACSREVAECRAHLLIAQLERAMFDLHCWDWPVDRGVLLDELTYLWHDALTRP